MHLRGREGARERGRGSSLRHSMRKSRPGQTNRDNASCWATARARWKREWQAGHSLGGPALRNAMIEDRRSVPWLLLGMCRGLVAHRTSAHVAAPACPAMLRCCHENRRAAGLGMPSRGWLWYSEEGGEGSMVACSETACWCPGCQLSKSARRRVLTTRCCGSGAAAAPVRSAHAGRTASAPPGQRPTDAPRRAGWPCTSA